MQFCETCAHITDKHKLARAELPEWWPWPNCTVCLLIVHDIVIDFSDHDAIERQQRR